MTELSLRERWQAARVEYQALAESEKAADLAKIPPQALEWLALLPVWTVGLARACGFPAATDEDVRDTLRRIHTLDLCQRAPAAPVAGSSSAESSDPSFERFWMNSAQRATVLARAIRAFESGRGELQRTIWKLAEAVDSARRREVPLLPIVDRWATLASAETAGEIGRRLLEHIAHEPPTRVARWLEAARPLEEIFKGAVTAAFVRALRQLEYKDRRESDRRLLKRYIRRPDQLRDFSELLSGPDDRWALHYIGAGGVGKTMLMRHLSAECIPDLGGSCARIDFDHINPDYPSRAPGLLLVQVAEELRLAGSGAMPLGGTGAEHLFFSFFDKMTTLREQLGASRSALSDDPIASPLFAFALDNLVEAMQRLPQPIVLLLDTCEELSKVQLDTNVPRNVADTFRILEGLHQRMPSVRVVFCGRRSLEYAAPRPYLRLHVMRGFDRSEAERFLDSCNVKPELHDAMLQKSRAVGFALRGKGQAAAQPEEQYSPYMLDLHATWAQENPNLNATEILDNRIDPFVRVRILSRLPPSLDQLLPAVALLGRFHSATLLNASDADPDRFDALFRELADQEWITRLGPDLIEVEPEMRSRLLTHVLGIHGPELERIRRRALEHLKRRTVSDSGDVPVRDLDPSEFEVTLRLLEPFPQEAAAWWKRVELGLARARADDWARDLTSRLLPDGAIAGPRADRESPLRPAILATLAGALARMRSQVDTTALWREVREKASGHPLADGVESLRLRATAALAARGRVSVSDLNQAIWETAAVGLGVQEAASVIAAIERLTEDLEGGQGKASEIEALNELTGRLISQVQKLDAGLHAFLRTLAARLCLIERRPTKADQHFKAALGICRRLESDQNDWLDWVPPDDLSARIRLEFVRGTWARLRSAGETLEKIGEVSASHADIDKDRLTSVSMQLSQALTVPEPSLLFSRSFPVAPQALHPVCRVHREVPPSFAVVARGFADLGRGSQAIGALEAQARTFESAATALEGVLDADRAWLYAAFRLRLGSGDGPSQSSPVLSLSASPSDANLAARWIATLPPSVGSTFPFDKTSRAWLRNRPLFFAENLGASLEEQIRELQRPEGNPPETLDELERWVESFELNRIARDNQVLLSAPVVVEEVQWDVSDLLLRLTPADAVVSSLLRAWALGARATQRFAGLPAFLAGRLGARRVAWIALDEGTLLSWRSATSGVRLLETAARSFKGMSDRFGMVLAQVTIALTHSRSGARGPLSSALARLRKTYEPLRKGLDISFSWDQLVAMLHQQGGIPQGLGPPTWQPWLFRIAACVAWAEDGLQAGPCTTRILEILTILYGASAGEAALPPEFEFLRQPQRLPDRDETRLRSFEKLEGDREHPVVVPETSLVRLRCLGSLQSWPLPLKHVSAEAEFVGLDTFSQPVRLPVTLSLGFEPYLEIAGRALPLVELWRPRRSFSADRVLQVDLPLAWICWEAALSLGLLPADTAADLRPFRWTLTGLAVKEGPPLTLPVRIVSFGASLGDLDMIHQGWAALRHDHRFDLQTMRAEKLMMENAPEMSSGRVVHVIGRPVGATSGPRLELGEASESRTMGRGQLLASHDLLRRSPRAQLFVIQPEVTRIPDRSGSDREQAAYLRLFAAELHAAGAPAVLVLPSLTQEESIRVLQEIAEALREFSSSLVRSLLGAVERVRTSIVDNVSSLAPADRLEQAMDVTLYAAETIQWQVKEES